MNNETHYYDNNTIQKSIKRTKADTHYPALFSFGTYGFAKTINFRNRGALHSIRIFSDFIDLAGYKHLIEQGETDAEQIYNHCVFNDGLFEYIRKPYSNVEIDDDCYGIFLAESERMNTIHKEKFIAEIQQAIEDAKKPMFNIPQYVRR